MKGPVQHLEGVKTSRMANCIHGGIMNNLSEAKKLRKLWSGFMQSRVLLTANNLRIFDHLVNAKSAADVAGLLRANVRATEILLDALAGLGLTEKTKKGYKNSLVANELLVSGKPYYQGDILAHADHLWTNWSGLDDAVKNGYQSRRTFGNEAFIKGMHNIAVLKAKTIIREINLKGMKKALDLGGGPGTYSIEMSRKIEEVVLFDLPDTVRIAKEITMQAGAKNISFIEGDFLKDNIGSGYDLVFISQILHSFSETTNLMLLKKAYDAMSAGGTIAIQEHLLGPDRTKPLHGALFSINMLVNTSGGRSYSGQEIKKWLVSIGFKKVVHKIKGDVSLVFGRK
jgi:ubiquinone/menaquinone biosynthesis C-methylase UbiE